MSKENNSIGEFRGWMPPVHIPPTNYRLLTKLREGHIFTSVCNSFCGVCGERGCVVKEVCDERGCGEGDPDPEADPPGPRGRHPPPQRQPLRRVV